LNEKKIYFGVLLIASVALDFTIDAKEKKFATLFEISS